MSKEFSFALETTNEQFQMHKAILKAAGLKLYWAVEQGTNMAGYTYLVYDHPDEGVCRGGNASRKVYATVGEAVDAYIAFKADNERKAERRAELEKQIAVLQEQLNNL